MAGKCFQKKGPKTPVHQLDTDVGPIFAHKNEPQNGASAARHAQSNNKPLALPLGQRPQVDKRSALKRKCKKGTDAAPLRGGERLSPDTVRTLAHALHDWTGPDRASGFTRWQQSPAANMAPLRRTIFYEHVEAKLATQLRNDCTTPVRKQSLSNA